MQKTKAKDRLILGVDPGTRLMGYGLIRCQGKKVQVECYGIINLEKYQNQALKLKKIAERMAEIIEQYQPDEMALEAPFYGKNIQVALKLGRAQGVAMAAALVREIPITEYAPRKIKQAVTGNGNASKEQVAAMLAQILDFQREDIALDATDALGVALCHYYQNGQSSQKVAGWGAFVKQNPKRIR